MVAGLLREILVLQAKLEKAEQQSFFFRKSIAAHRRRLESLKKDFEQLKDVINKHQLEEFLEWKNEAEIEYNRRKHTAEAQYSGTLAALYARIKHMGNLVKLKSKYMQLNSIEEYLPPTQGQQYSWQ